jgi:hypothetical protein
VLSILKASTSWFLFCFACFQHVPHFPVPPESVPGRGRHFYGERRCCCFCCPTASPAQILLGPRDCKPPSWPLHNWPMRPMSLFLHASNLLKLFCLSLEHWKTGGEIIQKVKCEKTFSFVQYRKKLFHKNCHLVNVSLQKSLPLSRLELMKNVILLI